MSSYGGASSIALTVLAIISAAYLMPMVSTNTSTFPPELQTASPISHLSATSKVQERIVQHHLYNYVDPHLPTHQSGFRKRDGTELQLARLVSEISESRDNGKSVVVCFFDLSKAFDRVWHQGLSAKQTHLGVCEDALAWLSSYLTKRRQRVRVNSSLSPWLRTPAGVPQGSVLDPLLFLIYTIDLPQTCTDRSTTCSQFADDTALITTHESVEEARGRGKRKIVSHLRNKLQMMANESQIQRYSNTALRFASMRPGGTNPPSQVNGSESEPS